MPDTAMLSMLTIKDLCALLRISEPTLRRKRALGEIPEPLPLNFRQPRWSREQIDAWLRGESSQK